MSRSKSRKQTTPEQAARDAGSMLAMQARYSGPLPMAKEYEGYELATPGAGLRILAMAESEQRHRQELEKMDIEAMIADARQERAEIRRAQWLAWSIALLIILIGGGLVYSGYPVAGSLLTGGTLIGVISAFLSKRSGRKES